MQHEPTLSTLVDRSAIRSRLLRAIACTIAGAAAACGAPAASEVDEQPTHGSPPFVLIDYSVNACPDFISFSVEPKSPDLETPALIQVVAEDLESPDLLYSWSATSGSLLDHSTNDNVYRCEAPGDHVVSVLAVDQDNCGKLLRIYITCHST